MIRAPARLPDAPRNDHDVVEAYYRQIAPFYDAELNDRADLDFWQAQAALCRGGWVLDLGAGTGTVAACLARPAGLVVGVDLSSDLLQLARERLAGVSNVMLLRADMRDLVIRQQFDLIVGANDPFSHLVEDADRDRVLATVARLLAPGGRFVLDALRLSPADAAALASPSGRVRRHTTTVNRQHVGVVERWHREPARSRCCHAEYEYRLAGQPPVVADFEAHDWSPDELTARLTGAGLKIEATWGSYNGEPWHPALSERLIVVAARR